MDLFLYHATDRSNLKSILEHGLKISPPRHAYDECEYNLEGQIFLAFDARCAFRYGVAADNPDYLANDIVVLKIPYEALNPQSFFYDWNVRCEYTREIESCAYCRNIPPEVLSLIETPFKEPEQSIFSFEGTELFDTVTRVFDEEVETNLEREDEL